MAPIATSRLMKRGRPLEAAAAFVTLIVANLILAGTVSRTISPKTGLYIALVVVGLQIVASWVKRDRYAGHRFSRRTTRVFNWMLAVGLATTIACLVVSTVLDSGVLPAVGAALCLIYGIGFTVFVRVVRRRS